MSSSTFLLVLLSLLLIAKASCRKSPDTSTFSDNYAITWGGSHASLEPAGGQVQLSMDNSSGSGFASKSNYGSGFFHMRIKVPGGNSAGVVTAFYLSSHTDTHDELDFEFLGNLEGKPHILQTNIFINGKGNREQKLRLWFDAAADFHDYKVLWNPYLIVFFVDDTPIRVYKNKTEMGVDYPLQAMQIIASLWNGESWATAGGKEKIDWRQAPFKAQFQDFDVSGCSSSSAVNDASCSSPSFWWNAADHYSGLSKSQLAEYERVKKQYTVYDYCKDKSRSRRPPPECS